jgi:hypothetical protein
LGVKNTKATDDLKSRKKKNNTFIEKKKSQEIFTQFIKKKN